MVSWVEKVKAPNYFPAELTCCKLSIRNISVPQYVVAGKAVTIDCQWRADGYDINGGGLYSLKWYHGLHEFYRWTPRDNSPMQTFPLPSKLFSVDFHSSSKGRVLLRGVRKEVSGTPLRCEVSGEPPFFQTDTKWAYITVAVLPGGPPFISGDSPLYSLDAPVQLTCTIPPATPSPSIIFTINKKQVDIDLVDGPIMTSDPTTGLQSVSQTLHFPASLHISRTGIILVQCIASIPDLYTNTSSLYLQVDVPEELRRTWHFSIFNKAPSLQMPLSQTPSLLLMITLSTFTNI